MLNDDSTPSSSEHATHDETPYDRDNPFARIHNQVIFDKRLKPNDARLLNYVLAKPDGWQCKEDVVSQEINMGRDAYYASVKRLIALGYCVRTKSYDHSRKMIMWHQQWFRTPRAIQVTSQSEIAHRLRIIRSRDEQPKQEDLALRAPPGDSVCDLVFDLELVVTKTEDYPQSVSFSRHNSQAHKHTDPRADLLCRLDKRKCDHPQPLGNLEPDQIV